jgi:hypothetical protein
VEAEATLAQCRLYSGTTLTNKSGSLIGAHQKIDRAAYAYLSRIVPSMDFFPIKKDILHFEGKNGPDGIKRKSPARDEPWHFYDPFDEEDTQLLELLNVHYDELVKQLKKSEPHRAAFDAAWIAHAVVDGLTPAHHFPYEEKLIELRGGDLAERNSIKNKLLIPANTKIELVKKNWQMWGVGGLMSMHGFFEVGVAMILAPLSLKAGMPSDGEIEHMVAIGWEEYFKRAAREVALLSMYDRFHERGWSPKLIRDVRNHLGPTLVRTVTLVWYSAMRDAGLLITKR